MANTLSNCSAKTAAVDANHPAMLAHAANVAVAAAKNKASLAAAAAKKDASMVPSRQSPPRVAKSNSVYGINANALFSTSTRARGPPILPPAAAGTSVVARDYDRLSGVG